MIEINRMTSIGGILRERSFIGQEDFSHLQMAEGNAVTLIPVHHGLF